MPNEKSHYLHWAVAEKLHLAHTSMWCRYKTCWLLPPSLAESMKTSKHLYWYNCSLAMKTNWRINWEICDIAAIVQCSYYFVESLGNIVTSSFSVWPLHIYWTVQVLSLLPATEKKGLRSNNGLRRISSSVSHSHSHFLGQQLEGGVKIFKYLSLL